MCNRSQKKVQIIFLPFFFPVSIRKTSCSAYFFQHPKTESLYESWPSDPNPCYTVPGSKPSIGGFNNSLGQNFLRNQVTARGPYRESTSAPPAATSYHVNSGSPATKATQLLQCGSPCVFLGRNIVRDFVNKNSSIITTHLLNRNKQVQIDISKFKSFQPQFKCFLRRNSLNVPFMYR